MAWSRRFLRKENTTPTLLALLSAIVTFLLMLWGVMEAGELYTYNLRCQWRGERDPGETVFVLVADEGTVQSEEMEFGTFPWPRRIWAFLQSAFIDPLEPNCIAYDIIFDQLDSQRGHLEDSDEQFAKAIENSGNVFLAFTLLEPSSKPVSATESLDYFPDWRPPSRSFQRRFALNSENVNPGEYAYGTFALRPTQDFERVANGLGHTTTPPDPEDGTTRRFPLIMGYAGNYYPSLPLVAVCHYLEIDLKDINVIPGDALILRKKDKSILRVPIDRHGNLILNYYGKEVNVFPSLTIKEFLQQFDPVTHELGPDSNAKKIRGSILIIGSIASSTHDLRPVTVSKLYPMVGNIATAIANILNEDFLYETSLPVNLALLVLISILFAGLAQSGQHFFKPLIIRLPAGGFGLGVQLLVQLVPTLGVAFVYGWFSYFLLVHYSHVIPMFHGLFSLALTYVMLTLYNFANEEQSRRWFQSTWSRYMSPEMILELRENPEQLNLGGEERELTILFTDICGFTSLSERLTPHEVVQLLNEYFDVMVEAVHENRGMLDKYIGDAIMVHFGSPKKGPDDALRAVKAGLAMQERLIELSKRWETEDRHPLHRKSDTPTGDMVVGNVQMRMRVGINTGTVVVGNIGSDRRHEYTAIGDNVNIAQRLESNCPPGGVLISLSTYELVKDHIEVKPLEPLKVKGREQPVEVYLVRGLKKDSQGKG